MKITISNDNKDNKFPVKSFKFKFFRQITAHESDGQLKTTETKIFAFKEPGVAAYKSTKRDFEFELPFVLDCESNKG